MRGMASVVDQLSFWSGELEQAFAAAGARRARCGARLPGTAGHLTLTLPTEVTQALLTRVAAVFHGGIDDVLLTGLALR